MKYILDQKSFTLISRFFIAQKENPTKGDWVNCVRKLMIDMNINFTFEDISKMKKRTFINIVNKQVLKALFKYPLPKIKSKGKEIKDGN